MNAISKIEAGWAVYRKIAAVQGALSKIGIAKLRRNQQGSGYDFRGIDDVYSALSPLLAEHGLVIVPRMTERVVVERLSKAGGALFNVTVKAEFDFIAAEDGSIHTASTYGEAMDSADKATNKAMSAAYKYAAFMTFAIPTEGDNDADAHTHEIAAGGQSGKGAQSAPGGNLPHTGEPAPAKGPAHSNLKTLFRRFTHALNGCGDQSEYDGLVYHDASQKLIAEIKEKLPDWWEGGEGEPEEFVPLKDLMDLKMTEFANHIADIARA